MNKTTRFFFSTLVAAAAMTSTAFAEGTTLYVDSSITENTENTYKTAKDALDAANDLAGATINLNGMTVADSQNSEFGLTNAGTYVITGGNGATFTPVLANGKDVNFTFSEAFISLGKLRGGKDGSGCYQKNEINIVNSVIASSSYAGFGGGWATFYDCSVKIDNSIYGINLSKYEKPLELPRSATAVKDAIAEETYTLASGSGYNGQHIGTTGSLDIDDSTVFTGFFSIADRGYADIDNSVVYVCGSLGIGDGTIKRGNDSNNCGWTSTSATDYRVGEVATMDINNSIVRNITLNGEGGGLQVGSDSKAGILNITNSEFDFTAKGETSDYAEIYANGTVNVVDSVFKVGTLNNKGTFTVAGNSAFKADKMTSSTDLLFGGANEKSDLAIGSVCGQGLNITASRVNLYKANITLTDNVTVSTTGVLSKIQDSVVDMNGKTLTFNGFTVLDGYSGISTPENGHGVTLKNGEFKANTNHLCFQGYNHVIAEDAVVTVDGSGYNSSMVNVYGKTTVYGKINVTHGNFGYDNVGTTDIGWSKGNYPVSELTLSGNNASYTIENGHMFRVYHETANTGAGVMNIVGGASFSFTGSRAGTGLFYNSNIVNVDAQSSFTVDTYYGHAHEDANIKGAFNSEKAGEMVVLGKVTVNKDLVTEELVLKNTAQLNAGTIKVIGLTIHQGTELNVGAASQGVALMAVVSAIEFETLTIIATDVVAGETLDLSDVVEGSGADALWQALADKEEAPEFTVIDSNTGKTFTAVYSAENGGTISVIPEPSMFGLLAGLGALALVGARRRRR